MSESSQGRAVATTEAPMGMAYPNQGRIANTLQQIADFRKLVRKNLREGHDYGVIPGTNRQTLLKPGAEKIVRLLGLSDHYEVLERVADWEHDLHQYVMRAELRSVATGAVIAQGVGECNSRESKYRYRWVWDRELKANGYAGSEGLRERTTRTGVQYRIPNAETADVVNTIMKMAKKRALVDVVLSVASLSDLFDDEPDAPAPNVDPSTGEIDPPERPKPAPQSRPASRPAAPAPPSGAAHPPLTQVTETMKRFWDGVHEEGLTHVHVEQLIGGPVNTHLSEYMAEHKMEWVEDVVAVLRTVKLAEEAGGQQVRHGE